MNEGGAPGSVRRRLLVIDRYDGGAIARAAAASAPGDAWDLLLLGRSREWFQWRHTDQLGLLPNARVVDPAGVSAEAHTLVAGFLVEYVARLPSVDLDGDSGALRGW